MATKIIDGKEVEVVPAVAKEVVKHKTTGKVYASKAEFDADVANQILQQLMKIFHNMLK